MRGLRGFSKVPDAIRVAPDMTGRRLRTLRRRAGLTQEELAEAVGLAQPTISMIESGDRALSVALGVKMASVLRVSPEMVLLGREAKP